MVREDKSVINDSLTIYLPLLSLEVVAVCLFQTESMGSCILDVTLQAQASLGPPTVTISRT